MNIIIIILSILLIIAISYIVYINFNKFNKKVRFSNIKEDENDIIISKDNYKPKYDEMSFLDPDYEQKRMETLKYDLL